MRYYYIVNTIKSQRVCEVYTAQNRSKIILRGAYECSRENTKITVGT